MFEGVENIFLWAQIAGFMAMSCGIISMQLKESKHMILCGAFGGTLWTAQYTLLGAPMGAIANASGAIKNLLIPFVPKRFIPYILAIYILIMWSIGLYYLNAWYALLPLIGASMTSIALLINRDNRELYARAVVVCCLFWSCYNITVGAYMGLACDTLTIISSLIGMCRHEKWEIGKCYRSFLPSLIQALLISPNHKSAI